MNRLCTRLWALCLVGSLAVAGLSASSPQGRSAPDVLLITVDTLRADRLQAYGYTAGKNPNITQLASDGLLFETVIAQAPTTLPSHATILTGTYPNYHGVRDVVGHLRPDVPTLGEALQKRGYSSAAFVGASVLSSRWGLNRGFDEYHDRFSFQGLRQIDFDRLERRAEQVVDPAIEWVKARDAKPFFLWVHVYDPHDPYTPPEPFLTQFRADPYDGEIAYTDQQIGSLIQALKDAGRYDNTLIVFTSDHGEGLGQHDETYHGFFIYEESIRVPLIVKMPGGEGKGRRIPALVRTVDLMPTVAQVCAAPVPESVQGESLLGLIAGKRTQGPGAAYSETLYPKVHFNWSPLFVWRTARYKYIEAPRPELYDLESDPRELDNIHEKQRALANRLQSELTTHRRRYDAATPAKDAGRTVDPETLEKLKSLGYVGFSSDSGAAATGPLADPKDKIGVYNQLNRAIAASRRGSADETIRLLEEVQRIEPTMPLIHFLIGQEYFNKQWYLKAIECFRNTLKYNPSSNVAAFNLARSYYEAGYPEKAEVGLRQLIVDEPGHFPAYHLLASILFKRKEYQAAIEAGTRAVQLRPDHADGHNNLGSFYFQVGDPDRAHKHYLQATAINPEWALPHSNLALVYLSRKDWESAEAAARRSVQLEPRLALGHYYLGQALRGLGRQAEAAQAFARAQQLNPRLSPPPQ